ncbi:hypothetical protein ACEWY4_006435 [Coilia grayii]|uniref:Beta-1,4-galactosyltransferase n=1 Tax=Coilia grayii TaxID=363190 RepID=A0ABD1KDM9_9TELE
MRRMQLSHRSGTSRFKKLSVEGGSEQTCQQWNKISRQALLCFAPPARLPFQANEWNCLILFPSLPPSLPEEVEQGWVFTELLLSVPAGVLLSASDLKAISTLCDSACQLSVDPISLKGLMLLFLLPSIVQLGDKVNLLETDKESARATDPDSARPTNQLTKRKKTLNKIKNALSLICNPSNCRRLLEALQGFGVSRAPTQPHLVQQRFFVCVPAPRVLNRLELGEDTFNRAKLLNVGYTEALKDAEYDCFIFSDVDLIPMDDRNLYHCYDQPRHFAIAMDKFGFRLPYAGYFGGVSGLSKKQFLKINGFPNEYWGWGGEDDDIYNRITLNGMKVSRPDVKIGRYRMIKHERDKHNEPNPQRFNKIQNTKNTMRKDGISSLVYRVVSVKKYPLYTNISVEIGKPPPRIIRG